MRYCHCSSCPPISPSLPSSSPLLVRQTKLISSQQRAVDKRGNLIFLPFCFKIYNLALTTAIKKSEAQLNAFNGLNLYERPRQRCKIFFYVENFSHLPQLETKLRHFLRSRTCSETKNHPKHFLFSFDTFLRYSSFQQMQLLAHNVFSSILRSSRFLSHGSVWPQF